MAPGKGKERRPLCILRISMQRTPPISNSSPRCILRSSSMFSMLQMEEPRSIGQISMPLGSLLEFCLHMTLAFNDITNVAIEWSQWNISQNPHLAGLISVRSAKDLREDGVITNIEKRDEKSNGLSKSNLHCKKVRSFLKEVDRSSAFDISPSSTDCCPELENQRLDSLSEHEDLGEACIAHQDSPILVGVVNEDERFDFCMCNPPFFASMEEAGMNPHTSCGGTSAEMVYPRGEEGFISKIINDSIQLKEQIHWFTTMVGRKVNLKILIHKLREIGVKILKTTEFVQGRTCRWGLAWTYNALAPQQQLRCANMKNVSFLMEGLSRQCKAYDVLQALCSGLLDFRVTCKVDPTSFMLKGYVQECLPNEQNLGVPDDSKLTGSNDADRVDFTIMVFEQGPGTLLIKGRLLEENTMPAGDFVTMLTSIEQKLKHIFCMRKELNS
ncbi:hypothetical protein KP509_11G031600 [Ceratopteris richardii]|uniref:U6 small nuclear RNA (adenine-(43)-N(6))-methyltransferase n=1 Tax=Ceratopteris richardii TaxID=49495 RepID=A0A8T2TR78_CERRI|nr:hypothetical protein KP509_11G031600 [Ceratopteris richardii]